MAIFFILGLAIGSFINALVYRLHEGLTLGGRSFCPRCKKKIFWHDNIPLLSFLFLKGRCRNCQGKISFRYPIIELSTGLCFAAVASISPVLSGRAGWVEITGLLFVIAILIGVAAYDLAYMEIPLVLVVLGILLTFFLLGMESLNASAFLTSPLGSGLAGGSALGFFFFLLVFFSKETWMGWGDVWIGFLGGLIVGLPYVLFLLTLSSLLGATVGTTGILLGKKKMKSALPFAPFLVVGIIGTVFLKEMDFRFPPFFFP